MNDNSQHFDTIASIKSPGSRLQTRLCVVFVVIHLLIVVPLAFTLNLGTDEGFSLETTSLGLSHAIDRGLYFELQPPAYFAILNVWRSVFGKSIFAARLFSIVCAVGSLFVLAALSKRFLPRVHSPRLVAVAALHPFVIWCAVEIRLYAMMLLLSSLLLLLFYDGFLADRTNRKARLWYGVLATLGLYTHYYAGFMLVANCGVLMAQARWKSVGQYLLNMLCVGVVFSPMVFVVPHQVGDHTGEIAEPWSIVIGLKHILWQAQHYLLPVGIKPTLTENYVSRWAWRILPLVAVVLVLWKARRLTFWRQNSAIWLMCAGIALFFVPLLKITGSELLSFRHTIMLFVPVLIGSFAVVAAIGGNRAVGWWSCAMICFGCLTLLDNYHSNSKGGDWIRVARHIEQNEAPSEPVVVFIPWASVSFGYHYEGQNQIVVLPQAEECETFAMHEYVLTDSAQIESVLSSSGQNVDSLWLVTSGPPAYMGVDFNWSVLNDWVSENFEIVEDREFNGSRVQRLKRRGPELALR
jgi:uncharacterized membrane protein